MSWPRSNVEVGFAWRRQWVACLPCLPLLVLSCAQLGWTRWGSAEQSLACIFCRVQPMHGSGRADSAEQVHVLAFEPEHLEQLKTPNTETKQEEKDDGLLMLQKCQKKKKETNRGRVSRASITSTATCPATITIPYTKSTISATSFLFFVFVVPSGESHSRNTACVIH